MGAISYQNNSAADWLQAGFIPNQRTAHAARILMACNALPSIENQGIEPANRLAPA